MDKVVSRNEINGPLSEILGTIALVAVVIIGGAYVISGHMAASVFILFVIVFARIIPPIKAVAVAYSSIQKGNAAAVRLVEIIDADELICEPPHPVQLQSFSAEIVYQDVSFTYADAPDQPILDHLNLTIPQGKTIAIVGHSGTGKSTLVDLLLRFYDVTGGAILIDGTDIRQFSIDSLRRQISVVTQDCILFNDTIANNISLGNPEYCVQDIREAARLAYANQFIETLPEDYGTMVGDRGITLSGGQRQRISLARAFLKNSPILILDEATSALDNESERYVQQAIGELMKGRTTIIIAHRLSTVRSADLICLLDNGTIVEQGSHEALLARGGIYSRMISMQTLSFENNQPE